jgi:tripartite-type tricarboxylate transporter receptor subunit TctC
MKTINKLLFCLILLVMAQGTSQSSQPWKPSGPIEIVVGFAPGGGADTSARLVADKMSERLGVPVRIVNKPGAGSGLAMQAVKASPADGLTIALATPTPMSINHVFNPDPGYDPIKDFAAIGTILTTPYAMITSKELPGNNIREVTTHLRENHQQYSAGGVPNGKEHIMTWLFLKHIGIHLPYAPYKGGALAQVDLLGGHIHLKFDTLGTILDDVQSGRVNLQVISWPEKLPQFPNVPTFAEINFPEELNQGQWYGLVVRKDTPRAAIDTLHLALRHATSDPTVVKNMERIMAKPGNDSPNAFQKQLDREFGQMQALGNQFKISLK